MWVSVDGLWGIFCGTVICLQLNGKLVNIIEIHVLVKSKWDTNANQTKPNQIFDVLQNWLIKSLIGRAAFGVSVE